MFCAWCYFDDKTYSYGAHLFTLRAGKLFLPMLHLIVVHHRRKCKYFLHPLKEFFLLLFYGRSHNLCLFYLSKPASWLTIIVYFFSLLHVIFKTLNFPKLNIACITVTSCCILIHNCVFNIDKSLIETSLWLPFAICHYLFQLL